MVYDTIPGKILGGYLPASRGIITISRSLEGEPVQNSQFDFTVNANGKSVFSNAPFEMVDEYFYNFDYAVKHGGYGTVVVRTFLEETMNVLVPSGERMNLPVKEVRGWYVDVNGVFPLTGEAMLNASCVRNDDGSIIDPEPSVNYCDAHPVQV